MYRGVPASILGRVVRAMCWWRACGLVLCLLGFLAVGFGWSAGPDDFVSYESWEFEHLFLLILGGLLVSFGAVCLVISPYGWLYAYLTGRDRQN